MAIDAVVSSHITQVVLAVIPGMRNSKVASKVTQRPDIVRKTFTVHTALIAWHTIPLRYLAQPHVAAVNGVDAFQVQRASKLTQVIHAVVHVNARYGVIR
jgi:hypothetical protein